MTLSRQHVHPERHIPELRNARDAGRGDQPVCSKRCLCTYPAARSPTALAHSAQKHEVAFAGWSRTCKQPRCRGSSSRSPKGGWSCAGFRALRRAKGRLAGSVTLGFRPWTFALLAPRTCALNGIHRADGRLPRLMHSVSAAAGCDGGLKGAIGYPKGVLSPLRLAVG